jgi:hypothetical protein
MDTYETQIPVGTMIIDLVDVGKKEAVWRGRAEGTLHPEKDNEAREENLIAILQKLFAGFPPGVPPRTPSPLPL